MNTTLVIFAIVAAFGLAAATLVVPMVPQALGARPSHAQRPLCSSDGSSCQFNHPQGPF